MVRSHPLRTIIAIEDERHAGMHVARFLQYMADQGEYPKLCAALVHAVDTEYRLTLGVMALSSVRWSDVRKIDPVFYLNGVDQSVRQAKTRRNMLLESPFPMDWARKAGLDFPLELDRWSYSALSLGLQRAKKELSVTGWANHFQVLHIFRHLNATFWNQQGMPKAEISARLGHSQETAVNAYLH